MAGAELEFGRLREEELDEAAALIDDAFARAFRSMFGSVPPGKGEGERVRQRFYRPSTDVLVIRDEEGLGAVIYAQVHGSRGMPGPVAIAPRYQVPFRLGTFQALRNAVMARLDEMGAQVGDAVTFADSIPHLRTYWQVAIPVFQAPFLERRLALGVGRGVSSEATEVAAYSQLAADARADALDAVERICGAFWPGYHHRDDVAHVADRSLGETWIARQGGRIVGFAVTQFGPGSEAFAEEQLLVKQLYVDPGAPSPERAFHALCEAAEEHGRAIGLTTIAAMASTGRGAALDGLLARRWGMTQIHIQHVLATGQLDREALQQGLTRMFGAGQFGLVELR